MGVIKIISTIFSGALILNVAFAENNVKPLTYDASPLAPGSRIIAGDLTKNEFFITGKEEQATVKAVSRQASDKGTKTFEGPSIRVAVKDVYSIKGKTLKAPQIKTASNQVNTNTLNAFAPKMKTELTKTFRAPMKPFLFAKNSGAKARGAVRYGDNKNRKILPHKNKLVKTAVIKKHHKLNFYSFRTTKQIKVSRIASLKHAERHYGKKVAMYARPIMHSPHAVAPFKHTALNRHHALIKTALYKRQQRKQVAIVN